MTAVRDDKVFEPQYRVVFLDECIGLIA